MSRVAEYDWEAWEDEDRACHESSKLFRFFNKADARYHRLELIATNEELDQELRKVAEHEQSEILDEVKNKIIKFLQKYGKSPVLDVDPETRTILWGFRGELCQVMNKIKTRSNLLKHIQQAIPRLLRGVALETLAEAIKPHREAKARGELLSPKEAARMLGVNYRTLWRWAKKEGKIRYIELPSGRLRYYREEIESILKKRN